MRHDLPPDGHMNSYTVRLVEMPDDFDWCGPMASIEAVRVEAQSIDDAVDEFVSRNVYMRDTGATSYAGAIQLEAGETSGSMRPLIVWGILLHTGILIWIVSRTSARRECQDEQEQLATDNSDRQAIPPEEEISGEKNPPARAHAREEPCNTVQAHQSGDRLERIHRELAKATLRRGPQEALREVVTEEELRYIYALALGADPRPKGGAGS